MRAVRFAVSLVAATLALGIAGPERLEAAPPAGSAAPAAQGVPEIEAAVRALVAKKGLKDAQIGVEIIDVETGAVLGHAGEHLVLNPASNAKLYTAAAALATLHGSHRYQTTLSGTIKSDAVDGPLVLRGHGDPSLRTEDLWAMARDLHGRGVRRVDGDILVDQDFFDDKTTPPAFDQQPNEWAAFRAPVSAVAIEENTVTLVVRPGKAGSPAHAWFDPPGFVDVDGKVKTSEGGGADAVVLELAGAGPRMTAKLSGAIGEDARVVRYTRRVEDPRLLAGYALKSVLDDVGVKVTGDVKLGSVKKASVLARHESEPLAALLYALGKQSDNFYAEMIFKSLAAETRARPGKSEDAADIVTRFVTKNDLGDEGFVVKNGSGLFDANRTTAHSVAKLLRYAWRDAGIRDEYVAQLSIGGVDGTLHKRFRGVRAHRAVRAKTGTLDSAIALSGYVLAPPGKKTIAFSILFNHVAGKQSVARIAADELVEAVHDHLWE